MVNFKHQLGENKSLKLYFKRTKILGNVDSVRIAKNDSKALTGNRMLFTQFNTIMNNILFDISINNHNWSTVNSFFKRRYLEEPH